MLLHSNAVNAPLSELCMLKIRNPIYSDTGCMLETLQQIPILPKDPKVYIYFYDPLLALYLF